MARVGTANRLLLRASEFAVGAHAEVRQELVGTTFPFAVHPLRVGAILELYRYEEDVVCAGILHDLLDDTEVTREELEREFGKRVTQLVLSATEPDKQRPWAERKANALGRILHQDDPGALGLIAADRLDNVREMRESIAFDGEGMWKHFRAGREEQEEHYLAVCSALLERDPENPLFHQLSHEARELFSS